MAKSQYKANNNNNNNNRSHNNNHYNNNNNRNTNNNQNNQNNRNNFKKNKNKNKNFDNRQPQQQQQQQQQRAHKPQAQRVNKSQPLKEIPINHNVKAPLFNKSKLSSNWKFTRKIGPGFINGQNTCFLNSVLECLTYTPPLAQYLLTEPHKKSCRMDGYCALCAMELHTRRSLKDQKSFVKGAAILPSYFTSNLKAISKTLRLGRQEDAHEFYMFLLSAFQKSSIAGLGKLPPKIEETALIYQIFGGKLRSQLKCFNCKATSNNFEACLDLSVDLNNNAESLEHTLENFIKVDKIDGYKCDSCKQIVKAGKQMTINELPMMLTVHLKRFSFDLQRGYMRKIGTHIKYPEVLDMSPYISKDKKISNTSYKLYAVLVHFGYGCDSGHYYAYVKAPNDMWYRMDDEDVQQVSVKEVMSQNAYMLFYQQEGKQAEAEEPKEVMEAPPVVMPVSVLKKRKIAEVEEKEEKKENKPVTEKKENVELPAKKSKDEEPPVVTTAAELPVKKRRVVLEPLIISDKPDAWCMQSSDKPIRSLRGNLSPPTYGAAVSDPSSWTSLPIKQHILAQKLKKRRVFRKNLESRKSSWKIR